jgi:hypothetical protein
MCSSEYLMRLLCVALFGLWVMLNATLLHGQCCPINLSFERPSGSCFGANVGATCVPSAASDEVWQSCPTWGCGSVDIGPNPNASANMGNIQPTAGDHYVSMECSGGPGGAGEGFSLTLCQGITLVPGSQYCITLDLITRQSFCTPFSATGCQGTSRLIVYGSVGPCGTSQTLWTSPALTGAWASYSFCFVPTGNWNVLSFRVRNATSGFSAVAMDNMSITRTDGEFLNNCTTLDVEWMDVDVQCSAQGRRITWLINSDDDTLRFDVERSTDLMVWEPVGSVHAEGVNGQPMGFSLVDNSIDFNAVDGIVYYRVGSVQPSGTTSYSPVVTSPCDLLLFPNPASDHIMVRVARAGALVQVVDAIGRLVRVFEIQGTEARIPLDGLAAGYYAVRLMDEDELLADRVFIKY